MVRRFRFPGIVPLFSALLALPALAQAGAPTLVPAVLRSVQPVGVQRGRQATFTLDGLNIQDADHFVFDDPAITGEVTKGPNRNQAKVTATVGEGAAVGIHRVSLHTPLGTTGGVAFAVGAWPEIAEREPNDTASSAPEVTLPATLLGSMNRIGDADCYRFHAAAGEELVFQVVAGQIRSRLNPVLSILDEGGKALAETTAVDGRPEVVLGYRFKEAGTYAVQVRDFENATGADTYYRLNAGRFAYATEVFPLGVPATGGEVTLRGWNLGEGTKVQVPAGASVIREAAGKPLLVPVRLAVGAEPEVAQKTGNGGVESAQAVPVPAVVNGRLAGAADYYRFTAKAGQRLALEVAARRFGSPLDSVLEVLDAKGNRVEQATLRPVWETTITLKDRESTEVGLRLLGWNDLHVNDYVYIRGEVLQVVELPRGPDGDCFFRAIRGVREGLFGTTPGSVALNSAVYKVLVYPPNTSFPPNGMPLFHLYYRNDDGGPLFGKDSRLIFNVPADGEYVARLADVRGDHSPRHAYRLTVREAQPDFRLTIGMERPNLPVGSAVPVDVAVDRLDDYQGPIDVHLEGLPKGFYATDVTIEEGKNSATLLLTAAPNAKTTTAPLKLVGQARIGGKEVSHVTELAGGAAEVTVMPAPDLSVKTTLPKVTLHPGEDSYLDATITRENGFAGRVPMDVKNLPNGVKIENLGLNGILLPEGETARRIFLHCEPWARPGQRLVYCTVRTETASSAPTEVAAPFVLEVVAK